MHVEQIYDKGLAQGDPEAIKGAEDDPTDEDRMYAGSELMERGAGGGAGARRYGRRADQLLARRPGEARPDHRHRSAGGGAPW